MTNLELTPFSESEKKQEYSINTFVERGIVIDMIRPKKILTPNSGTSYRFGTRINNEFYWFFKGKSLVKNRAKAIEVFKALIIYCDDNDKGSPFMTKVYK